MLKKVLAVAAIAGAAAFATPASAEPSVCLDVYIDVNGNVVAQNICVPPA